MSGNRTFEGDKGLDKEAKNYISQLFEEWLLQDDGETVIDMSSSRSQTSDTPNDSNNTIPNDIPYLETAEDIQNMFKYLDHVQAEQQYLENEIYNLLINAPEDEMPPSLAKAILVDQQHSDVQHLVNEVIAEHPAEIASHMGVMKTAQGNYRVSTRINAQRISCRFATLEQAVIAYLYVRKTIAARENGGVAARIMSEALTNDYYKELYNNLQSHLDKHKSNGVDIEGKMNKMLSQMGSSDRRKGRKRLKHI